MSEFTEQVLNKIQQKIQYNEAKANGELPKPSISSEEEFSGDLEIGSQDNFDEDNYSENIFNDEADVKDHDTDDIPEDEDITEGIDSIDELREKQKDKKKKKSQMVQEEEPEIVYVNQPTYSDVASSILGDVTYDEEVERDQLAAQEAIHYNETLYQELQAAENTEKDVQATVLSYEEPVSDAPVQGEIASVNSQVVQETPYEEISVERDPANLILQEEIRREAIEEDRYIAEQRELEEQRRQEEASNGITPVEVAEVAVAVGIASNEINEAFQDILSSDVPTFVDGQYVFAEHKVEIPTNDEGYNAYLEEMARENVSMTETISPTREAVFQAFDNENSIGTVTGEYYSNESAYQTELNNASANTAYIENMVATPEEMPSVMDSILGNGPEITSDYALEVLSDSARQIDTVVADMSTAINNSIIDSHINYSDTYAVANILGEREAVLEQQVNSQVETYATSQGISLEEAKSQLVSLSNGEKVENGSDIASDILGAGATTSAVMFPTQEELTVFKGNYASLQEVQEVKTNILSSQSVPEEAKDVVRNSVIFNNPEITETLLPPTAEITRDPERLGTILGSMLTSGVITEDATKQLLSNIDKADDYRRMAEEVRTSGSVTEEIRRTVEGTTLTNRNKETDAIDSEGDLEKKKVKPEAPDNIDPIKDGSDKKAEEWKEKTLHEFSKAANFAANKLEGGGQEIASKTEQTLVGADKNAQAGKQKLDEFARPVETAVAILALGSMAAGYGKEIADFGKAGKTLDGLFAEGKMNVSDLALSHGDLKKVLKDAGVDMTTAHNILKNQEDLHAMFGVRGELKDLAKVTGMDSKMLEHLNSKDFFDMTDKKSMALLNHYFKNSPDDVLRKQLGGGFSSMSTKDYKKLIKTFDKNEISANGQAAVRLGEIMKQQSMAKSEAFSRATGVIKGNLRKMISNVTKGDANVQAGAKEFKRDIRATRFTTKTVKKLLIGTKRGGYKGLLINGFGLPGAKKLLIGTKAGGYKGIAVGMARLAIKSIKAYDMVMLGGFGARNMTIAKSAIQKRINNIKDKLREAKKKAVDFTKKQAELAAKKIKDAATNTTKKVANTAVGKTTKKGLNIATKAIKEAQKKAREAAAKMASTKAAKIAAATGKFAGRGVKAVLGTAGGALGFLGRGVGKVFNFVNMIKRKLLIGLALFVIVFFVLVVLIQGVISMLGDGVETAGTVICPEREEFLFEMIGRYEEKFQDIKDKAIERGEKDDLGLEGKGSHIINRYGHPMSGNSTDSFGHGVMDDDWTTGYKIYYVDVNGNIIQEGCNNVKDVICLTYVQMDAEWDISDESDIKNLGDKYFEWLNPQSNGFDDDSIEENFYFCDDYCETVYYVCNDDAECTATGHTYVTNSSATSDKNDGAVFKSTVTSKDDGDYTICDGHDVVTPTDCDSYKTKYYHSSSVYCGSWNGSCPGHSSTSTTGAVTYTSECKGHKGELNCSETEHTHTDASGSCYGYVCGYDHAHANTKDDDYHAFSSDCWGLTCELDEHTHDDWTSASDEGCYKTTTHTSTSGVYSHGKKIAGHYSDCDSYTKYCTGHNTKACYGHYDAKIYITVKQKEDVFAADYYPATGFLSYIFSGSWDSEAIEWVNSLYDQDWYELYGVDPSGGYGFIVSSALSDADLEKILSNCGKMSAKRETIIKTALGQVGAIPYYFGGKPKNGGTPLTTNVGSLGGTASKADASGRTIAGLDCFGFCQWVYWTANGSNVMPEGSSATTTTVFKSNTYGGLTNISADKLKPGDLGFQAGHVGIFAGVKDGKMMWIHCTGAPTNTVVYNDYTGFSRYYRLSGMD